LSSVSTGEQETIAGGNNRDIFLPPHSCTLGNGVLTGVFAPARKPPLLESSGVVVRDKRIIIFFLDLRIDSTKARPPFGPGRDQASTRLERSLASPYFLGNFFLGHLNR
jgi:hypothetical protein